MLARLDMTRGDRVLVTGAGGFIGRHTLAPLMARGFEVHAVARSPAGTGPSGVHWHPADLLRRPGPRELVEQVRPERLLHFAWIAEHGRYWTAPENLDWVAASLDLLRAFAQVGGQRAVLAGSCAEYDWAHPTVAEGPCHETATPIRPATLYGTAKDALRRVVESWSAATGLEVAWGRIFFCFGPGEHPDRVVASIARAVSRGEPAPCTAGHQRRDFLDVGGLGDAFAALLAAEGVTGAVNVASGRAPTVAEVATRIGVLAARPDLIELGSLPSRPNDPPLLAADISRLRREVRWQPEESLDRALIETLSWWRDQP